VIRGINSCEIRTLYRAKAGTRNEYAVLCTPMSYSRHGVAGEAQTHIHGNDEVVVPFKDRRRVEHICREMFSANLLFGEILKTLAAGC
jgi:hypothetical protein